MFLASGRTPEYPASPQYHDGGFRNPIAPKVPQGRETITLWWKFMTGKRPSTRPSAPPPVQPLTARMLAEAPDNRIYRLGHSTVLVKLDGGWWLTDPVFSKRASPLSWAGPSRFQAPPIALEQLPPLRGVILSHDHYDHLDKATIRALAARTGWFVAPLGVGDLLVRWGVDPDKVVQLDWWQSVRIGAVDLTAAPAQHFSGRGLFGRNSTLWASWAIHAPGLSLFFSGDSGYSPGFAEIGERLGPFDLTLIECGAYDPLWEGVHMLPEQTVQAHLDVGGRWLLPIHNGTFDLAFHDWDEPMERVLAAAQARGVAISTPLLGQAVDASQPPPVERWWRLPAAADKPPSRAVSAAGPAGEMPR
ncbi:MBL fold metallo-hydrolase [Flavobacterium sp. MXW15]|uniref:MBL fold metallo-hydrolase n=1 Tax=Xanthomonas chitinilytica TaxID=2989819 RepID=A0ABT3JYV5_9XANT|nr:MBL fold metallo-hydrolase [Xanthomonas sp. H13-6]MCW4456075.1 MBL fold metallo-hydrolase [Flavobacterium sp. MXW15]MCW4473672.1 MBL fold metallo-hydrolase [Xanthomonas sp. H13-6]